MMIPELSTTAFMMASMTFSIISFFERCFQQLHPFFSTSHILQKYPRCVGNIGNFKYRHLRNGYPAGRPMQGMVCNALCPEKIRGGVINLFRGSHPTLLLSYGTKTKRKPMLLCRLSGLLLFRVADRQFSALLFQLPPRITRFEPTIDALVIQLPPLQGKHLF